MTCNAEINRSFHTRDAAFRYLASRGFLCGPQGWANGRWAATVEYEHNAFHVAVWLRMREAA